MLKDENNISVEELDGSTERLIDLSILNSELLITLEKDLKEIEELELHYKEDENKEDDNEERFLTKHFEELEELKEIFSSSDVTLEDINWFFDTALFDFMNAEPESFVIEPMEIYKCMLEKIQISPKKVFEQHLKILLDKKTKDKSMFAFVLFFPILREAREKGRLSETNRKRKFSEDNSISAKRIKLPGKISPLALPNNRLSNQVDDECHESLVQSGMKLS